MPRKPRLRVEGGLYHVFNRFSGGAERFGQSYNRRHRSSGPLWQSRFKAKLVEDRRSLLRIVAYIHLNPVTAGVVSDPAEHRYCGHRELLGIDLGRLVSPGRDAETCRLRYLVAGVGIERWGQRPRELARNLGRWPEAVGRWAKRAGELRLADEDFRATYETLDERLSKELGDDPTA